MKSPADVLLFVVLTCVSAASTHGDSRPTSAWKLEPVPHQWTAHGFVESLDLSGIASGSGGQCVVASDELAAVQLGRIDRAERRIVAGALVPLAATGSVAGEEIDIEGVAATPDGRRYFVTGSHGVGKKKGDMQAGRYAVYELPVDPKTGEVRRDGIRKASLRSWFEEHPKFGAHIYQPLQFNGVNIEGLAYANGRLYFGLRGPSLDGMGHILEIDAKALFAGGTFECVVHALPLGLGRGVRDLVSCRAGFLVLTGNASAEGNKKFPISEARAPDSTFELAWWRPGAREPLAWIGALPVSRGKAEAVLVLEESASHLDLLFLFDGEPEGGPVAYRLKHHARGGATASGH